MRPARSRLSQRHGDGGTSARSPQREKRERDIVDVAAEMFHHNGYANTSIQDIAEATGIRKGSLYHYIDSKEDLLYCVLLDVLAGAQKTLDCVAAMTNASPLERIGAYVHCHLQHNLQHQSKVAVFYHDFHLLSANRSAEILRRRRAYEDFLETLLCEAQEAGQVELAADPRALAHCMFGAMNWAFAWRGPGDHVAVAQLPDTLATFAVNGLHSHSRGKGALSDRERPTRRSAPVE
jgi:TetR/AcrR family transcriptional regulator, cholesterol catabolism regulator